MSHAPRTHRTSAWSLATVVALLATTVLAAPADAAKGGKPGGGGGPAATTATSCADGVGGTWTPGELDVYWFDVEQGDGQLIVGPTGRTLLIDLGENVWNRTTGTNAERVAGAIQAICGVSGPVHLDYVMASHLHLDHIGYAGNPNDTTPYGNGLYQLLHPDELGFTVGTLLDRDGGTFVDADGNGTCEVGTNASPSPDVVWHHAGTTSSTGRRWICWLHGPDGQRDRANIEGRVVTLTNDAPWPTIDLGAGVTAEILQANAKGVMQADGTTPVAGDHTAEATPPSENDYSVAVRVAYGEYEYATAGDTDGEYATSSFGYTYNDVEGPLAPLFGDVETMRVNHHGSSHSTSSAYTTTLAPETAVISCGANSYGHPAANVLDELATVVTSDGVGADVFMTNNPCDPDVGTVPGAFNTDGDIWLHTTDGGAGYTVVHDAGTRTYTAHAAGGGGGGGGAVSDVVINEVVADNAAYPNEWVELHNPTGSDLDLSGLFIDDVAGGGGAPQEIPAGTVIPAGGHHVVEISGFLLNNDADDVRLLAADQTTVYDETSYVGSADDASLRRAGDGGAWCSELDPSPTKGTANPASCPGGAPSGSVSDLVINEYVPDNNAFATEWVELYNPTGVDLDASGLFIDDIAGGGGAPQELPAGAIVPAGGHYVFAISGFLLNNTGDDVRLLSADQATVYDATSYTTSADDQSFHRIGDGGAWCTTLSSDVTQGSPNPATCP